MKNSDDTSAKYSLARSILGTDFIAPDEVTGACPNIIYSSEQLTTLDESQPSEDVLKWCRDNDYVVMPAPPTTMSTLNVREIQSTHFYLKTGGWFDNQKFAREEKTSFGWMMVKKTHVSNSTSKTWNEQNKLLSALEKVPNVAEMSWFITTYFKVRGVRLFEGVCVRTSSFDSDGYRVGVGVDSMGLNLNSWDDVSCYDNFGLSATRKQ